MPKAASVWVILLLAQGWCFMNYEHWELFALNPPGGVDVLWLWILSVLSGVYDE